MVTRSDFEMYLRDGLHHLYDPDALRKNPLTRCFGVVDRYDAASAVRRILTEAIAAMEPSPHDPPQSHTWRMYNALHSLYIEQMTQQEAADQLGLSDRQLRREQRSAIQALAQFLWTRYDLENTAESSSSATDGCNDLVLSQELAWIKESVAGSFSDPAHLLPDVIDIVEGLAAQHNVRLASSIVPYLPLLAVHPIAFRQAFLNLCSAVIPRAAGGTVYISIAPTTWAVSIRVYCPQHSGALKPALADEAASLNVVEQLATLSGGQLSLTVDSRSFDANLTFPVLEQVPVLLVDDNADALQLLQRYATGTRYRLVTTRDPAHIPALIVQHAPQIIVLDVMMPNIDGWEVLRQLRKAPETSTIPVIVCTILPQRDLAFFLGASGYLRKPVMQQDFLAALDQQMSALETTSR